MLRLVARLLEIAIKIVHRLSMLIRRSRFRRCGRNVRFGHDCDFSFGSIELGNDVYIGPHARFMSAISSIRIGNKVLFGPGVTILGGDHRFDVVGVATHDVLEKLPENDSDVEIQDDVWIGANVTILKGVTVGRGSVVGAGSVVTRSLPPYSVAVGNPARVVKSRFTPEQVREHEARLAGSR